MVIGVPKETYPGERRAAIAPEHVPLLTKAKFEVVVESGLGVAAGFPDAKYSAAGAKVTGSRRELFAGADLILQVRTLGANPEAGAADLELIRPGQVVVGLAEPLTAPAQAEVYAKRGAALFALELVPRITRAQTMDVLSSMATIAGYKAVLIAAEALPRMFPMLMTAAGTVSPARVFVVGAGVAGLQAIATAKRLGAVVNAYDVRPAVKEQVESLGARFIQLELETADAETKGGYARELGEDFYRRQREMMAKVVAESDVVITTAAVPGKKAPVLVTAEMVRAMSPGSVVVDLAAERGGNCELTQPGRTVDIDGVTVAGPLNLPATVPYHATQMFGRNLVNFIKNMAKDGVLTWNMEDEIVRETLVCRDGKMLRSGQAG